MGAIVGAVLCLVLLSLVESGAPWPSGNKKIESAPAPLQLQAGRPALNALNEGAGVGARRDDLSARGQLPAARKRRTPFTRLGCGLSMAVTASEDNRPVEGAVAGLLQDGEAALASERTDASGLVFLAVPCGSHWFEVTKPGFVSVTFRTTLSLNSLGDRREIVLHRAIWLTAQVVDDAGNPLFDAIASTVPVDIPDSRSGGAKTNRDGFFELQLAKGRHRLLVQKSGFGPYTSNLDIPGDWPPVIELRKRPGHSARFSGVVVNGLGEPIPGARLALLSGSSVFDSTAGRTDEEGRFEFAAPRGESARLRIDASGCLPLRLPVELSSWKPRRFALDCYPTFRVTALDQSGKVLENPFVEGFSTTTGETLVQCSNDGLCYSIRYPVLIQAVVLQPGLRLTDPLLLASYTPQVELRIGSSSRLSGVVTDSGGRPIKGYSVRMLKPVFGSTYIESEDATFTFDELPGGEYLFSFVAPNRLPVQRQLRLPESGVVQIQVSLPALPTSAKPRDSSVAGELSPDPR